MPLSSHYAFTLPRGYVDGSGEVHREGVMRLATARDELEPLRDPMVTGPDDPRITILVLARVVEKLGTLTYISSHEIEGLFAADLAFLQDFYGVINFGNQEEYEELLRSQAETPPPPVPMAPAAPAAPATPPTPATAPAVADEPAPAPAARRGAILEMPGR